MIKFENQKAFEQHLSSLRFTESSFLIIVSDERERQDVSFRIKRALKSKVPNLEVKSFYAGRDTLADILTAYNAMSLFSTTQVVEIQNAQLLSAADLKNLTQAISKQSKDTFTIITSTKTLAGLPLESHSMAVLDLSQEKPWDHKKRVMKLVFDYVRNADKTISYDAVEQLVDIVGIDYGKLIQQAEILICLVGDSKGISVADLKTLTIAHKKQKTWQLAECLTWGESDQVSIDEITDGEFYSLLMQVRSRLEVGVRIKEEIRISDLSSSLLRKYVQYCQRLGKDYFIKAFNEVYEIERLAKKGQFPISLLFDMLYVKLHQLRENSQCSMTKNLA